MTVPFLLTRRPGEARTTSHTPHHAAPPRSKHLMVVIITLCPQAAHPVTACLRPLEDTLSVELRAALQPVGCASPRGLIAGTASVGGVSAQPAHVLVTKGSRPGGGTTVRDLRAELDRMRPGDTWAAHGQRVPVTGLQSPAFVCGLSGPRFPAVFSHVLCWCAETHTQ